jgi:chromosome segregation and condensation protein ScpB
MASGERCMSPEPSLSDKALAVFAFAAYHQLESGLPVTKVIRSDGAGHTADEEAIAELVERELIVADGNDLAFSQQGLKKLGRIIEGLRADA